MVRVGGGVETGLGTGLGAGLRKRVVFFFGSFSRLLSDVAAAADVPLEAVTTTFEVVAAAASLSTGR